MLKAKVAIRQTEENLILLKGKFHWYKESRLLNRITMQSEGPGLHKRMQNGPQ